MKPGLLGDICYLQKSIVVSYDSEMGPGTAQWVYRLATG
jgi:hypothetical protein